MLTGEGLCYVEFQGAPHNAQNWFVGSADIKNAFHQMRIPGWLQAFFFALSSVLASEVGYSGKTISQKRLVLDSLIYPVPTTLVCCCQDVTDNRTSQAVVSLFAVTIPLHRCSEVDKAWDRLVSAGRMPTISGGVLDRGVNCANVHLARLIVGAKRVGLDVHDESLADGTSDVLQIVLRRHKQTDRTYPLSRADDLFASWCQRVGHGVNGDESLLALSNRGALFNP